MKEWPITAFRNIYAEPSKNGLTRPRRVRGSGYKMINMGELFAHSRINNPPMDLVPLSESEKEKFAVKAGDLLFARQSLIASGAGKCSIVLNVPEFTTFESHIIRVRLDSTKAISLFYYYYFLSPVGKGNIQSLVMQVAAAGIRGSELGELAIPTPPLPTQRKIASILSAYDELIENNTRRIAILEEMAQSLYREWFVHFRFPGYEKKRLVESAVGLVPEGWEVINLRDISSFINRGVSPKYDDASDNIVINQRCIRNNRLDLGESRRHSTKVSDGKLVQFGDVLVNSTGIGTLGRKAQIYQNIPNCTVDSHVTIVRPNEDVNIDYYGFYSLGLQAHFDSLGVGSTGQTELSRESISNTRFLLPPSDLQELFSKLVSPMRKNIVQIVAKNANLRRTRDLLLPKLISGEVDVERFTMEKKEVGI